MLYRHGLVLDVRVLDSKRYQVLNLNLIHLVPQFKVFSHSEFKLLNGSHLKIQANYFAVRLSNKNNQVSYIILNFNFLIPAY